MDSKLKKIMVALYAILSFMLSATYASALMHPRRHLRSYDAGISVEVRPKVNNFYPGDTITIDCHAKGGIGISHAPFVSFSRRLGRHTAMPLSSSSPGITIRPGIVSDRKDVPYYTKSVKHISFGPDAYDMLNYGPNSFYCKGWNRHGDLARDNFIIHKRRYVLLP